MKVYQAHFEDVDYPKNCSYTLTFHGKDKAIKKVEEWAKRFDIPRVTWESGGEEIFFNHQFNNHPTQDNACYHGSVREIEVQ